ncbi:MAG: redoxin domain-containing protein [Planctomycetota bacterium]|nr:redoxin domain-containing protein [Planctomycetota bacterium]
MNARQWTMFRPALGLVMLAALLILGGAEDDKPETAKIGEKAPAFTLTDANEQERSLSELSGRIVILEWTNPDCPFVRKHYGPSKSMQKAYRKVKALDKRAVWLAIDSTFDTSAEKLKFWIKQKKIEYPILLDLTGEVARKYDARRTPHMFVIDKKGILRYHGAIDDDPLLTKQEDEITNYVVQAVRQIINDEVVSPDHVEPYGCSIKLRQPPRGG